MIAESVMKWLDAEGFGTEGTDLSLSHMPDQPDNIVTVYDESAPGLQASQAYSLDRFGIRIVVRGIEYQAVRDLSVEIHKTLMGFNGTLTATSPEVVMVEQASAPASLGRDEKKRPRWISRYGLTVVSEGDQHRS